MRHIFLVLAAWELVEGKGAVWRRAAAIFRFHPGRGRDPRAGRGLAVLGTEDDPVVRESAATATTGVQLTDMVD